MAGKVVRATVCPNCKEINTLYTVEEVIKLYYYNAETDEFEYSKDTDSSVLNVYCDSCGEYFDNTYIYDYVAELTESGELILGDEIKRKLTDKDIEELKEKLQKLF